MKLNGFTSPAKNCAWLLVLVLSVVTGSDVLSIDLVTTVHSLAAATQRKEEALRDAGSEHNQSSGDNMLLVQPQVRNSVLIPQAFKWRNA
jgi:hypothetical protein